MFLKLKYYGLLLLENVSVNLKSYGILWLLSSVRLGSSLLVFPLFYSMGISLVTDQV